MSPHLPVSAQQVSLTCAGPQDTRVGGREGTDPVGRVQPMGTCFEHHRQIPLQLLWGYWDPLTLQPQVGAAVIQTTSVVGQGQLKQYKFHSQNQYK